jgi:hypothetical protein
LLFRRVCVWNALLEWRVQIDCCSQYGTVQMADRREYRESELLLRAARERVSM